MASDLKLQSQWINDRTIRVSWMDVKIRERNAGNQMAMVVVTLGGFFLALGMGLSSGNLWGLLLWLGAVFGWVWWASTKEEVPNSIDIGSDATTHNGRSFNTQDITRFEMGTEVALLGASSTKPIIGENINQTIIRMWLNDTSAYDLAKHNWQQQVSHEINSALTNALKEIRDLDKQQEHAEKFGVVDGDTGMPDY